MDLVGREPSRGRVFKARQLLLALGERHERHAVGGLVVGVADCDGRIAVLGPKRVAEDEAADQWCALPSVDGTEREAGRRVDVLAVFDVDLEPVASASERETGHAVCLVRADGNGDAEHDGVSDDLELG